MFFSSIDPTPLDPNIHQPPVIPGLTIPEEVRRAWGNIGYISLISGPYNIIYGLIDTVIKIKKAWNPKNETPERATEVRKDAQWAVIRNIGKISRGIVGTINGLYLTKVIGTKALPAVGPLGTLSSIMSLGGIAFEANGISYCNEYKNKIEKVIQKLNDSKDSDRAQLLIYQTFMQELAEESYDRFSRLGLRLQVSKKNIEQLVKGIDDWKNLSIVDQENKLRQLIDISSKTLEKIQFTLKNQKKSHYISIVSYISGIISTVSYFLAITLFPPLILLGIIMDFVIFFLDLYNTFHSFVNLEEPTDMFLIGSLPPLKNKKNNGEKDFKEQLAVDPKETEKAKHEIEKQELTKEELLKLNGYELMQFGARSDAIRFVNKRGKSPTIESRLTNISNENLREHLVTNLTKNIKDLKTYKEKTKRLTYGDLVAVADRTAFVFQKMTNDRTDPRIREIVPFLYNCSFYTPEKKEQEIPDYSLETELNAVAEHMTNHYLKNIKNYLTHSVTFS